MKQSDIVKKIRKLGYKVTVLTAHPANRGGIPDILISYKGSPWFVEIKIDKDKVSKLQQEFINEFHNNAFVLHYDTKTKRYSAIKPNILLNLFSIDDFISILNSHAN